MMRVLKLAGCEQLTDVGLTWLAEGCRSLEEIDFSGCTRVRNENKVVIFSLSLVLFRLSFTLLTNRFLSYVCGCILVSCRMRVCAAWEACVMH